MLADNKDYAERVKQGKQVERVIFAALQSRGLRLLPPTDTEDMDMKVDAWILDKHGAKHSLQIKFRESGPDILFEIIKNVDRMIAGRDWISLAEYYFVLDQNGTGRLYLTEPIKAKASSVKRAITENLSVNPAADSWNGAGWQAKIRVDRAHGQRKLVAYFDPNLFEAIAEWPNITI